MWFYFIRFILDRHVYDSLVWGESFHDANASVCKTVATWLIACGNRRRTDAPGSYK